MLTYRHKFYQWQPFKITFYLSSPIALNHPWLHFDGLIAHLSLLYVLGNDFYLLPAKFPLSLVLKDGKGPILPLKKTGQLWHASVSILEPYKIYLETLYKRFEDRFCAQKKKIRRGSGYFKDYAMKTPYISARTCTFYAVGDIEAVAKLCTMIVGLGNETRIGFGAIRDFVLEPTDKDYSIVKDGKAMRPIPKRFLRRWAKLVPLAWTPPYWARDRIELCAPPFTEVELGEEMARDI